MRYAAVTPSARTLLVIVTVLVCGALSSMTATPNGDADLVAKQANHPNEQVDMTTRSIWTNDNPVHSFGMAKRSWQNLQGGWGKRYLWSASNTYPLFVTDKRAWKNLQGAWGKRYAGDEAYAAKLAALLADEELQQLLADYNNLEDGQGEDGEFERAYDIDADKRGWRTLNNAGWGKRSAEWNNFRGSWGKRDPQWTNLKGIWGKRIVQDGNAQ